MGEAVPMWKYMCMCCVYLQYQQYRQQKKVKNTLYSVKYYLYSVVLSACFGTVKVYRRCTTGTILVPEPQQRRKKPPFYGLAV